MEGLRGTAGPRGSVERLPCSAPWRSQQTSTPRHQQTPPTFPMQLGRETGVQKRCVFLFKKGLISPQITKKVKRGLYQPFKMTSRQERKDIRQTNDYKVNFKYVLILRTSFMKTKFPCENESTMQFSPVFPTLKWGYWF